MKKKIKIIDILCYTSTGDYDKLPKRIKYDGMEWKYGGTFNEYFNGSQFLYNYVLKAWADINGALNDEVEILDEEDEFEDIEEIGGFTVFGDNYMPIICELKNKVDKLIKNQKKILERLNNLDND